MVYMDSSDKRFAREPYLDQECKLFMKARGREVERIENVAAKIAGG